MEWYKHKHQTDPYGTIFPVSDMTVGMIGTRAHPTLATKAAETGTMVEFVRDEVAAHSAVLGDQGQALRRLGDALVDFLRVVRTSPRRLSAEQAQSLVDCAKRAFALREAAGVAPIPKWHLMLHLVCKAYFHGNPAYYATFLDESHNGALANMARTSHRLTWHRSLLAAFRWSSEVDRRVRARR